MHARTSTPGVKAHRAVVSTAVAPDIERDGPVAVPAWEITEAERQSMIAEAAYYHSVSRGFAPGCELDDWLAAEAEIEALLQEQGGANDRD